MWWCKKALSITLGCIFLLSTTGCTPLLTKGKQGTVDAFSDIYVENIPEALGQYMRIKLERAFCSKTAKKALFRFSVQLSNTQKNIMPSSSGLASRHGITTNAVCTLFDKNRNVVWKKTFSLEGSYGVLEEYPFSMVAVEKLNERAHIDRLVDDVFFELALFFRYKIKHETPFFHDKTGISKRGLPQ